MAFNTMRASFNKSDCFAKFLNNNIVLPIFCLIFLSSCCMKPCLNIDDVVDKHKLKLRQHFSGENRGDITTLIEETKKISMRLKKEGKFTEANKFDSYTDVLMFGNMTIDESLNDVMKLVKDGDPRPSFFEKLFKCK